MEAVREQERRLVNSHIGVTSESLNQINIPEINLAIWKREQAKTQQAAKELIESSFRGAQFIYDRSDPIELIGAFLDEKTQLKSENALFLWADIMMLTEKMLELCDDQEIGIGLERVTNDNCTSFHTDFLNLRLLCAYWGEATHWLENDNVNREGLGQNNNDLVVKDWKQVHKMEMNWVGLFKGDHYPGNKGLGIVHKSPEISEKKDSDRLLLRIDTIKSFGK